jgi:hypothetical protein
LTDPTVNVHIPHRREATNRGRGSAGPKQRPADRPYAEQRTADPEGNMFDISVRGFQTAAEAS